ncbi:pilin [Rhodanobacter sp. L36]|uniref:pilin n=1 Tax=Rhodanobacter sp. L36 TaxID=1747221 RepID=UPI00131CC476|nr:pilin [Rhodanobacter sp. L36]
MASEQNLKAIASLRSAIASDKTLSDAGATPYLLPLLADLRSPIELALIDPIGTPSPNTQVLVSMRMAQKSVDEMNARLAQIGAAALKLAAPLDSHGDGKLANGTPLHFDAASGRLFALASRLPADPAKLNALLGDLAGAKADSEVAKAISIQEQQIDQSGQGTFGWISLRGLGGLAAGAIPSPTVGTLPGDLTSKTESVSFGAGTVDGHGRLRIVVHTPQSRLLGYLAPGRFAPDFKVAGTPRWVFNIALPGGEQFKNFENNLSLDFGAEHAASVRNVENMIQQKAGFSIADLTQWIGPELIGFEDDAGVYSAVRVNDKQALYDHLQALVHRQGGSFKTQTIDGVDIHSLTMSHAAAPAADANPQQRAWATIGSRFSTHLYWIEDGHFLIFARVPQALADRGAAKLDTSLDAWLKTQAWHGNESLFGFTTVSHDAQRDAYYGYLQVLQLLGDLSGEPTDLASMPAAHSLNLPRQGVIGMDLGATTDDLSLNITYEQQPLEMLTGSSGSGSMTTIAAVAIVAAVAIPAYQDYVIKAQVNEGVALAGAAKTALTAYHQQHGHWPKDNQQAGLSSPTDIKGRYVDSITAESEGDIRVHFSAVPPSQANAQLGGKTLIFTPDGDAWHCHSDDIVDKNLPADCRKP